MRLYDVKGSDVTPGLKLETRGDDLVAPIGNCFLKILSEPPSSLMDDERLLAGGLKKADGYWAIDPEAGNADDLIVSAHTGEISGSFAEALGYKPEGEAYTFGCKVVGSDRPVQKLLYGRVPAGELHLVRLKPGGTVSVGTDLGEYLVSNVGDLSVRKRI